MPERKKTTSQPEVSEPRLDPMWEQRVSEVVRERPTTRCPDCGSDHVIFYLYFKPSAEQVQAIEPYKDFIHFGWRTCCPPPLSSPRVLESWTCRPCGEMWDEVLDPKHEARIQARKAEAKVESEPIPKEPMYPASVVRILVDQANSLVERNDQLEGEKRSGFWYQMNESLHNPGDSAAWFMVLFIISIALTLPFLPGGAAFVVSAMIAAVPAALIANKKH
jgi:hypothetical protein